MSKYDNSEARVPNQALLARIAALEAALKPLAHVADQFDGMYETYDYSETAIGTEKYPVTVGDFRRIRALLNGGGK